MLIKNGWVIDPANSISKKGDILVEEGKIKKVGKFTVNSTKDLMVVDAKGMIVTPGFIDMHVHLREPGYEYKETIETGTKAAAHGGFTSICCMPNTNPMNDNATVTNFIIHKSKISGVVNVFPIGAITRGGKGEELAEIGDMVSAGIVGISDDGFSVMNSLVMRRAMEYSKAFNIPLIPHCEDKHLSENGMINEGRMSAILGLKGIPRESEVFMMQRDIGLAKLTDAKLHVSHLSTAESVDALRFAKEQKIRVTADVTPHHLLLTEDLLVTYDTNYKINPPLRTKRDTEALLEGLIEGVIDAIVTDHAPHAAIDKEIEFDRAPFGIIGLETAFPLLHSFVIKGILKIEKLIELLTINPAKIMGLKKGTLSPGADADITIIDPDREYVIDRNKFYSRSRNTPFHGWKVKGSIEMVLVEGKKVYDRVNG
jgi:dihydroorotase